MARRVFFSFHYERDIWRANQVRNSWVTKPDRETAGFWDHAKFEAVERQGEAAVRRWIDNQMKGSSVTVVLIGYETASRKWVNYEITQSAELDKGMLGIYIHNCKDRWGDTDYKGENPFSKWIWNNPDGTEIPFTDLYHTYDWVYDDGYDSIGDWVEVAARDAGR